MKIISVAADNRRKVFRVETPRGTFDYPYARLEAPPSIEDRIAELYVDEELGQEAFTYVLQSGREGTVHVEQVLDYNRDPDYLANLLVYKLTLEAVKRLEAQGIGIRQLARRLKTSPSQLYRLLDTTNYRKSLRRMLALLYALDCEIELAFRDRDAGAERGSAPARHGEAWQTGYGAITDIQDWLEKKTRVEDGGAETGDIRLGGTASG